MAIFLSFIYGAAIFYLSGFLPYTSLIISFSFLLLLLIHKYGTASLKLLSIATIIIFSAMGFFYAKLSYVPPPSPSELAGSSIKVKGLINSEKPISSYKGDAFLQNIEVINASTLNGEKIKLKELRAINDTKLYPNKIYYFTGRFSKDGYSLNPSSNDLLPALYILSSEEIGEFSPSIFEHIRQRLNNVIVTSFSDKSSAFLLSITTGERIYLTNEMKNAFNITGLAHILSISGSHFGLLFVILFGIFRLVFRYLPYKVLTRLTIYVSPSQIAGILTAPFLIFYLGISSMSIPTIRAFIMITFFLAGLLIGRKGFWLNTLIIAAFIIVLIDPLALTDLSAQLSFIAVICIGIVAQKLRDEERHDEMPKIEDHKNLLSRSIAAVLNNLKYSLLISLAASLGTAPLVAYHFHYFSLVSPITNLLIAPLIGFLILPFILISSMIYLIFDVFTFISLIDRFTLFILTLIEDIAIWNYIDIKIPDFPLILIITFYTGLLMFLIFSHSTRGKDKNSFISSYVAPLAIAILPMFVYSAITLLEPKALKITFLDVGQGDASVVELSDNRIIVIDTGKKGYQVGEYLRYKGIKNIDVLAISHLQTDHTGGIEYLLNNFKVTEIWISGFGELQALPEEKHQYRKLVRGDVINGNGYKINVLHPYDEFYTSKSRGEENNYSLVLRIDGNKNRFLFTGDIEFEAQEDLSNLGLHLKSTVLKVPHHGSKSSGHETFYGLVSPKIAVISVGRKNPHGHPHEETLWMLKDSQVFRTDYDGAIGLQEMPDGSISIKTCREFKFRKTENIGDEIFNIKRLFTVW